MTDSTGSQVLSDTLEGIKKRLAGLPPISSACYGVYSDQVSGRQHIVSTDAQSRNRYREYEMYMDGSVQYDEQSNYYGQTSPSYIVPSTGNMMANYSIWGVRACDPLLNSRQPSGDFLKGATGLSQAQAQAVYGFNLPQGMSSDMTQPPGVNQSFSEVERTLPTSPTCRSQPQSQSQASTILFTLPEGLSDMAPAIDPKNQFWNSHARGMAMPIVPNKGYTSPYAKPSTSETGTPTPDLTSGYVPMATMVDTPPPLPPAASFVPSSGAGNNTLYPVLDAIHECRSGPGRLASNNTFIRNKNSNFRLNALMSDCSLYSYGYSTGERSKTRGSADADETRCSAPTLMSGLSYSRVRLPEHNLAFSFDLLAEMFPEYGRVETRPRHGP
jgi:hypothetical protein